MKTIKDVGRPKEGDCCYYCGRQATQIDHVVPQSTIRMIAMSTENITYDLMKNRALTVHSCGECNRLLSDSYQDTLIERKAELKKRLRRRYKKILEMPDWNEKEFEGLEWFFQSDIEYHLQKKELVKKRLKW